MKSNRRSLIRMFLEDPHCHWCGRPVILILRPPEIDMRIFGHRDDEASVDHLRSRYAEDRSEPCQPGERRHVLSCWKCNNDRGKQEQASLPKEKLWERSNSYPLGHPLAKPIVNGKPISRKASALMKKPRKMLAHIAAASGDGRTHEELMRLTRRELAELVKAACARDGIAVS